MRDIPRALKAIPSNSTFRRPRRKTEDVAARGIDDFDRMAGVG